MTGSTTTSDGIVIAGGGLAAQRCAETLRRSGYDGAIRIVCAERHRPYGRDFTATFTQAGRPVAALLVDRPRSLPAARKMIENGAHHELSS
jgi:NADPH-dependent 2,4-dienoyl-CoA reductase/sulfur reductase-like enzyme